MLHVFTDDIYCAVKDGMVAVGFHLAMLFTGNLLVRLWYN
jgi:hypothetical protein